MGSKHKHKDKDKDKKRRTKEKKAKKEKRGKHHKRRHGPASGSGSDEDGPAITVSQQLAMGRAAARATREILAYKYELRKDLRELTRQLDGGGALDISGLPDAFLRARLGELFDNLLQLRKNSAGQYYKRQGAAVSVLSFVAPILEENPDSLAAYKRSPAPAAAPAAEGAAAAPAEPGGADGQPAGETAPQRVVGSARPPPREYVEGLVDTDSDEDLEEDEDAARRQRQPPQAGLAVRQVSPDGAAAPPPEAAAAAGAAPAAPAAAAAAAAEDGQQPSKEPQQPEDELQRRVVGPTMPSAELLAAAAQMPYPESEPEEEEQEQELLVGPPPPELAEEVDLASMDERSAEVVRVMRVLAGHASKHASATAAEMAEHPPDAYEVLGVEPQMAAGEVKKRYWRLSLLIHPDKCDHSQAHEAFQAVSVAAKHLQDVGLRKAVDDRREDARLHKLAEEHVAQQERERQWRVARGEATAEDLAGPVAISAKAARETWMTELPPERQANAAAMPSGGFQGFSSRAKTGRGDTSEWTMTPAQRALQLEGGAAAGQPLLLAGGAVAPGAAAKAVQTAAAVDSYNAQTRKKSLVEQHLERQQQQAAQRRKKQKTGSSSSGGSKQQQGAGKDWDPTQHPWQPWDREKEMGGGGGGKAGAQKIIDSSRNLASKFGGSQRSFL